MSQDAQQIDAVLPHVEPAYTMLPQCNDCKEPVAFRGAHFDGLRWRCLCCWERIPKPASDWEFG
jgi:hypothetical protein